MKKILVVLIVLSMTLGLLAGCTSGRTTSTVPPVSTTEQQPTETSNNESNGGNGEVEGNGEIEGTGDIGVSGENLEDDVPEEVEDPLEIFRTTWEIAERNNGLYLLKGEKIYNLNNRLKELTPGVNYPPALMWEEVGTAVGYKMQYYNNYSGTRDNRRMSVGEVPVVAVDRNDEIIAFSDSDVPAVWLRPIARISPSIYVRDWTDDIIVCNLNSFEHIVISSSLKNVVIKDSQGREMEYEGKESFKDLEPGEEYSICYFEGTRYVEFSTLVDSTYYECDSDGQIELEASLTKEGYAQYDFSEIPGGIYCIDSGVGIGVIVEIK